MDSDPAHKPAHKPARNRVTDLVGAGMALNAGFSALTGSVLALGSSAVADLLDVSIDGWLLAGGLALLAHAAVLVWVLARGDRRRWGWVNFGLIAPYPLAMVVVAVAGWVSAAGAVVVLLDGLIVAMIGAVLLAGLRADSSPLAR